MSRKHFVSALFAVVAILGFLSSTAVFGMVSSSGQINSLDLTKREINIKLSDGSRLNLIVSESATISRNGLATSLAELVLRDGVNVEYDPATKQAASITANGPELIKGAGVVKDVAKATGTVTVHCRDFIVSVKFGAYTKIVRNGRVTSLSRLAREDNIVFHIQPSSSLVLDAVGSGCVGSEVEGKITAVDASAGTLTIAPNNGSPALTLTVDENTLIELDGEPAGLGDLRAGMKVEAEYNAATMVALSIEAESVDETMKVKGIVTAVDPAAGTVTIDPSDDEMPAVTLTVTAATEIWVNDVAACLEDVKVGMAIKAWYDALTLAAKKIEAGSGDDDEEGEAEVEGKVTEVGDDFVTIKPESEDPITLGVNAATRIKIDGEEGTIDEIEVGDWAEAEYNVDTMMATKLCVETEDEEEELAEISGTVLEVGDDSVTIQPGGCEGAGAQCVEPVTLFVTADTKITVGGETATLEDVEVGDWVDAEYYKESKIAVSIAVDSHEAEVRGTVIELGESTVTIESEGYAQCVVTLTVSESTEILINGEAASFADIQIGDSIWALYNDETMEAIKLVITRE